MALASASGHTLITIGNPDVTEFWHPWPSAERNFNVTRNLLAKDLDMIDMILKADRNFHGQVLTALYDDWDPYSIVDAATGRLRGGIFPDVYDTLAERLNFTPR